MEWSEIANLAPSKLVRFLDLDSEVEWTEPDSISLLRNQLRAPLWPDLTIVRGIALEHLKRLLRERPPGETFQEHLVSPRPSVELLLATKAFAQQIKGDPANPLHGDPAGVIYFSAIAAGLAACRSRISSLSDEELREGFQWTMVHPAATELRSLLQRAIERLRLMD